MTISAEGNPDKT